MSRDDERSSIRAISIDPTGHETEPPPEAIGDEYRRFGHSSSWSFSRRIRTMITDSLGGPAIHDLNPIKDGAYGIPWQQNMIDLSAVDLPSEDYADYLTRTVIFTLSPLYTLLDQKAFLDQLHQFYDQSRRGNMPKTGLWHIQMLIIFAFGTSILSREAGPLGPTGALYFSKAMEAMPDCHRLCVEPIISIEILCMISLFTQAMDMRFAAQLYIRQASCIAAANGLNRRYDEKRHTSAEFQYRTKLWWTIYVIERKLSSLIGVSPGLPDEDIALRRPAITGSNEEELPMAFHVEISSQLGHILNVVYGLGSQRQLGGRFISEIQAILKKLADTATLLNTNMKIELNQPMKPISRTPASLYLLHHQCSILAIRPILFFLLEKKLQNPKDDLVLSDAVVGLLRVCIESAFQVLNILKTLRSQRLLDTLLPHDLEYAFMGSFVLVVVDIVHPALTRQWDLNDTFALIDECVFRGLIVAKPYKQDLIEINELRSQLRNEQRLEAVLSQSQLTEPTQPEITDIAPSDPSEFISQSQMDQSLHRPWNYNGGILDPDMIQFAIDAIDADFLNDATILGMDENGWMF
ncbi:hypothetical protein BP6252_05566 [Coleophoma cylindrospora]|uniref:Xylanolytic transcriptional activator regulatory domain-containing protein n=1 Tax=Coleophoma cylindrospora TaxID=1849047 RepID=A0A3D8RTY6_9HELO|nr:hypothetical protein BP6252_05566 [Coleophoma cylindrospora]